MPEFLQPVIPQSDAVHLGQAALRLLAALALGAAVAWIYRRTTADRAPHSSFPLTLALLAVLIAMVTQVIGDSVARAFSLVGALSIVRFRTVVRDTKDTAFVIFSVVVGMATGAQNPWLALVGIGVVGGAAFITAARVQRLDCMPSAYRVTVRIGLGYDAEQTLGAALDEHFSRRSVVAAQTAKQGAALNITYEGRLRRSASAETLVRTLNGTDGVQDVRFESADFEEYRS